MTTLEQFLTECEIQTRHSPSGKLATAVKIIREWMDFVDFAMDPRGQKPFHHLAEQVLRQSRSEQP